MTTATQTAKAIRKELKEAFPNIKFSVRSENFSMGDAVRISSEDEFDQDAVRKIVKKYQEGSFDMMTDMYELTNRREDIPQVKYVTISKY